MSELNFTPETRMLIDGALVESSTGAMFDNVNPATEEVLGQVADGNVDDMRRAIAAARRAFDETDWSTNKELRKHCLLQLQDAIEAEKEDLREELIAEVGAPRAITYAAQLDMPLAEALRWPARMIDEFPFDRDLPEAEMMGSRSRRAVWKEPMGVVGSIVPWNYPFEVTINKVAQVLATGNTTVLKPAPDTPWNATRLGRLVTEQTDIPAGVFNVVTSVDHMVGEELTLSPLFDMISFTGSTVTGKRIMEKGAASLKRVFLELGGKSAMMILDDADFATVVPSGAMVCMHAGQGCAMQTRMLLPRSRYAEGVELITMAMGMVPYGDPNDMSNLMGPLISAKQRDRVLGYIAKGVEDGAKLVLGGGRHRPGGDLRPRARGDPLRRRRGCRAHHQRQRLWPVRGDLLRRRGKGHSPGPAHPHRLAQRERRGVVRRRLSLRRLQVQRHRSPERHRGFREVSRDQCNRLALYLTRLLLPFGPDQSATIEMARSGQESTAFWAAFICSSARTPLPLRKPWPNSSSANSSGTSR